MQEARVVAMLKTNTGWQMVENFIKDNIDPIEKRLFNDNLSKEEFDLLQKERQAYKNILNFVDRRVEKVQKNT